VHKKLEDSEDLKEKLERVLPVPVPKPAVEKPLKDDAKLKKISDENYCPEKDAPYEKGQHMPFSLIVEALNGLEATQGKGSELVKKEIIANVFRTCIINNPEELLQAFYFFLVKLGPDFSGNETGVGEGVMKKCVAQSAGTSEKNVRETFQKLGDLGEAAK